MNHDHDPLCHAAVEADACRVCALGARVRADERERIAQEIERYDAEVCDPLGSACTCAAAAAIARNGGAP